MYACICIYVYVVIAAVATIEVKRLVRSDEGKGDKEELSRKEHSCSAIYNI